MGFFISSPTKTRWHINSDDFVLALADQWPHAKIRLITDPARKRYSHEWTVQVGGTDLEGMLDQQSSAVYLDGDISALAGFATWYRQIVPREQDLIVYDDSYNMQTPLSEHTSENDIVSAFA